MKFPDPNTFPPELAQRGIFEDIAIPLLDEYSDACWGKIINKIEKSLNLTVKFLRKGNLIIEISFRLMISILIFF